MKIAVVAVTASMRTNGVSRHAANLVGALLQSPAISQVHFLAGAWQREMFRETCDTRDLRFNAHFVNSGEGTLSRVLWYYRELPHIAGQLEPDVVHFACPAPIRAGAFRCSTVVSLHDCYPFDAPANIGAFRSSIARAIVRRSIECVDGIACASESTRKRLEAWFPGESERAVTIHNVVEPARSVRPARPDQVLDGQPFVLCIAEHRWNKNVPLAIRVFERVLRYRMLPRSARLLVVGIPGQETRRIGREIKGMQLERNVVLLSGLSDAELDRCYEDCRLLLAPSSIEGFGFAVAEAILRGCPVVCSDIPAFREIGGETCHYVAWGDGVLKRYASAVSEVLALPRPSPMALPHLSSRMIGQKYAEFYSRLACRGNSKIWYATATNPGRHVVLGRREM